MIGRREQQLLDWLSFRAPTQEPLYGDLVEEFGRRNSRAWFWQQLVYATAVAVGRHVWIAKGTIAESWALRLAMTGVLLFASYVTWMLALIVLNGVWMKL